MKSECLKPNSKPSYALMSTISGHGLQENVKKIMMMMSDEDEINVA